MPDFARGAETLRGQKTALRKRLLTARGELPESVRRSSAAAVRTALLDLVRTHRPPVIAAYVPLGPEPGGPDLPGVLAADTRLLLPVLLTDGDLDWSEYNGRLVPGRRGLLEPPGPRLGPGAVREAGLVVVPALAVDRRGLRMGRGGGSYDRALARLDKPFPLPLPSRTATAGPPSAGVLVVALLHDGELLDAVPAEPHDRRVDAVITPGAGVTLLSAPREWTK